MNPAVDTFFPVKRRFLLVLLLAFLPFATLGAPLKPGAAAIASAHPLATAAGRDVLQQGGNAFDAAVAIAAALGVVEPASSGLGGGGFWLLHRARDDFQVMVDARERAPLAASADMYLDRQGEPVPRLSLDGPLAAAIPGTPAALVHVAEHYGRLPLAKSLAPATRLARDGFAVTSRYRRLARLRLAALRASPAAAKVFLNDGAVPEESDLVRQPVLAAALERIAEHGHHGFYAGLTAERLVKGVRDAGGVWTREDLTSYRILERRPIRGSYGNMRITTASLPSSGGIVLLEILNMLRRDDLARLPPEIRAHLLIEAMRRAYRDRARYLGDPDIVTIDIRRLLDPAYADQLRTTINLEHATPSEPLPSNQSQPGGTQTTHFSVIDHDGNRVAATLTINYPFGCGFMPPGSGILLNNEMDDFVVKPGVPNVYGLVGSEANAIAPGKRPLSSMTPTFLETPDAVVILGTPGGSRIISMVLLAVLEFADSRGRPKDWVALPRFHHQYLPDVVVHEKGAFDETVMRKLEALGHRLKQRARPYGNMQVVAWYKEENRLAAASDPRGKGAVWVQQSGG